MAAIKNTLTCDSSSNSYVNTHRAIDMPGVPDGSEATKLAITTTNVSIYSNDMKVGFVQSFTPSEQRDITPIQELGTEGVVQMVPGNTRGGTIQMQRVALYNSDIWNALGLTPSGKFTKKTDTNFIKDDAFTRQNSGTYGNPFRTLKDQRVPLEIRAHTIIPGSDAKKTLIEIYYDCWISSYSKSIQVSQVWVSETVSIEYADVGSAISTDEAVSYNSEGWLGQ